jgi:D-alanyl-D-alanine carboxypeptidase
MMTAMMTIKSILQVRISTTMIVAINPDEKRRATVYIRLAGTAKCISDR